MADELDIEQPKALIGYLRDTGRIGADERPEVRVLQGGVSNRTVLLKRPSGEAWVLKQALAKLRVKVDWFSDVRRIHREALGLRWLEQLAPPGSITPLVFEDEAHHLLAMQAVPEPHENWKTMLLTGRVHPDHARTFGALLGTIHRRSWERRDEIAGAFDDRSFFESLRIEPYYAYAATKVPEAAEFLTRLIADTRGRRLCIVHGDYSPKNVLVREGQLILLDHEVIHWGDPAFDIGFALAHFLGKMNHAQSADLVRLFAQSAVYFFAAYDTTGLPWGRELNETAVRQALGCTLARVSGRSTLEYLSEAERERQKRFALRLMASPPNDVVDLVNEFRQEVRHAHH